MPTPLLNNHDCEKHAACSSDYIVYIHESSRSPEESAQTTEPEQGDEAEAEASLERILSEVEVEWQQEAMSTVSSINSDTMPALQGPAPPDSFASLVFPSIPDSPLPSLTFPSAPTGAPSTRKPTKQSPKFSDEEIDSWCIIYCANANIRCWSILTSELFRSYKRLSLRCIKTTRVIIYKGK